MKKPLVTILSPVYNGETYIERFINNILNIKYENIQFILVNDGSTDSTDKIIRKYEQKLKEKTDFVYIIKENGGAATAINAGLKYVKGKYLMWPDSDDIIPVDSVSHKVDFLEKNKECQFLISDALVYDESNLNEPIYKYELQDNNLDDLYDRLLMEYNIYYVCGTYMTRTAALRKALPNFQIYETKGGQNWQLLLPLAFYYKCGYLKEVTYHYIVRQNSHSHQGEGDYSQQLTKYNRYEDIILNVLKDFDYNDKQRDITRIKVKYSKKRMNFAIMLNDKTLFNDNYDYLRKNKAINRNDKVVKFLGLKFGKYYLKLLTIIKKIIVLPKRIIRKIIKIIKGLV